VFILADEYQEKEIAYDAHVITFNRYYDWLRADYMFYLADQRPVIEVKNIDNLINDLNQK